MTYSNHRKAAIRNSPNWLDALDLPAEAPLPRIYPEPRTAIAARRRELTARTYVRLAPAPMPAAPRRPVSAIRDAIRNAAILALVALAIVACVRW
jgi:hypothetical protein